MKKYKSPAMEELQVLFDKIDELQSELDNSRNISRSMYKSLTEVMVVVETLSRLLVSKNIVSKEEIKGKIKELNIERDETAQRFKKNVETEAYEDYLSYLLSSGSYGNA